MPNYDLQCEACGVIYEDFLPMDTVMPIQCPHCKKKKKVKKVFRKAVATYNDYSPLHPRKHRGRGY